MNDLIPVFVALIGIVPLVIGLVLGVRKYGGGLASAQIETAAIWRDNAEVNSAKADIWQQRYRDEVEGRAAELITHQKALDALNETLRLTRHDLDDCSRQKDDAYSRLRRLDEVPERRTPDRPKRTT